QISTSKQTTDVPTQAWHCPLLFRSLGRKSALFILDNWHALQLPDEIRGSSADCAVKGPLGVLHHYAGVTLRYAQGCLAPNILSVELGAFFYQELNDFVRLREGRDVQRRETSIAGGIHIHPQTNQKFDSFQHVLLFF